MPERTGWVKPGAGIRTRAAPGRRSARGRCRSARGRTGRSRRCRRSRARAGSARTSPRPATGAVLPAPRADDELEPAADAGRGLRAHVLLEGRDAVRVHRVGVVPDDDPAVLEVVDQLRLGLRGLVDAPLGRRAPVRAARGRQRRVRIGAPALGGVGRARRIAAVDAERDVRVPVVRLLYAGVGVRPRTEEQHEDDDDRADEEHAADGEDAPVGERHAAAARRCADSALRCSRAHAAGCRRFVVWPLAGEDSGGPPDVRGTGSARVRIIDIGAASSYGRAVLFRPERCHDHRRRPTPPRERAHAREAPRVGDGRPCEAGGPARPPGDRAEPRPPAGRRREAGDRRRASWSCSSSRCSRSSSPCSSSSACGGWRSSSSSSCSSSRGLLGWRGVKQVTSTKFTPEETIAAVKEDIEWPKTRLLRRG